MTKYLHGSQKGSWYPELHWPHPQRFVTTLHLATANGIVDGHSVRCGVHQLSTCWQKSPVVVLQCKLPQAQEGTFWFSAGVLGVTPFVTGQVGFGRHASWLAVMKLPERRSQSFLQSGLPVWSLYVPSMQRLQISLPVWSLNFPEPHSLQLL